MEKAAPVDPVVQNIKTINKLIRLKFTILLSSIISIIFQLRVWIRFDWTAAIYFNLYRQLIPPHRSFVNLYNEIDNETEKQIFVGFYVEKRKCRVDEDKMAEFCCAIICL